MMIRIQLSAICVICIALSQIVLAGNGGDDPNAEVTGVFGFTPVRESTYVSLFVPFDQAHALSGVLWYNNDGTVAFPQLMVGPGYPDGPGSIEEAITVMESVSGLSSGLSEIYFEEPIASYHSGLHVIFQLPENGDFMAEGPGGGVGFGYRSGTNGVCGWVSADGEVWIQLDPDFRFAVHPQLVAVEPGMTVLSMVGHAPSDDDQMNVPPRLEEVGLIACPNPFNPQTRIWFHLVEGAQVDLRIYNLRGELVRHLVSEIYSAGNHFVPWDGLDKQSRSAASGLYFIKLKLGNEVLTRRITLLR